LAKKVLPTEDDFAEFTGKMERNDFRQTKKKEFAQDFRRLDLQAPRKKYGREIGFHLSQPNGLTVVVWTTFLVNERVARDEDSGWVLIKQGDEVLYFAHPIRRTKGFFTRLYAHALLARYRVLNRPLCPHCHAYMDIKMGRGLGARYWRCNSNKHLGKIGRASWDVGLPSEATEFVRQERKDRERYRRRRAKEGKKAGHSRLLRKKWKVGKPENLVVQRRKHS